MYIFILKKVTKKGIKQMNKNLLSENMLRFGTKNLSEGAKQNLVLESVMETIKEHGLHNEVKRRLNEGATVDATAQGLYDAKGILNDNETAVAAELASIKDANQYNLVNAALKKLTSGKGVFAWIGSFIQGTDLNAKNYKGTSILDQLVRIWYPGAYKSGNWSSVPFDKDPWTLLNRDRSLYQKFQSGNKMGSAEDTKIATQYTKS